MAGNGLRHLYFQLIDQFDHSLSVYAAIRTIRILNAQSLANKLWAISKHERLPQQQYNLLNTPLILGLSADN